MIALNGLPHAVPPGVQRARRSPSASADRFFLSIETVDPKFDAAATRQFLEGLQPLGVTDVADVTLACGAAASLHGRIGDRRLQLAA